MGKSNLTGRSRTGNSTWYYYLKYINLTCLLALFLTATWTLNKTKNMYFFSLKSVRKSYLHPGFSQASTNYRQHRNKVCPFENSTPLGLEISSMPGSTMKIERMIFPLPINSQKEVVWKRKGKGDDLCTQKCKVCWLQQEKWMLKLSTIHLASHRSWYTRISSIVSARDLNKASPIWNHGPGS